MATMPKRVTYLRVSDDRQDFLRQVNGMRDLAARVGQPVPEAVWTAAQNKRPLPPHSPVLWDHGSRDNPEARPNFQAILRRVEGQNASDPHRLEEVAIYELDRFGVSDPDEWFHYRYVFNRHGCRIVSALKGDLSKKDDIRTIIETLFEAQHSRAEQKKTAGRVADQAAGMAKLGRLLGGVPRYGYDKGCFEGGRLVWRLHYRDNTDRLLIFATKDNPEAMPTATAQMQEYRGQSTTPSKSKQHEYRLLPSCDHKRVEGVKYLFKLAKALGPNGIGPTALVKPMATAGYTSYQGRVFDGTNLLALLRDETYLGRRPYAKRSVARHKRYDPHATNEEGRPLSDVPEDQKGKVFRRPRQDWIRPDKDTHTGLIDAETFEAVQDALDRRPRRGQGRQAPRQLDNGNWLKPLLFCQGCGRQMDDKTSHGYHGYCCPTYTMKYQRPGDPRFQCDAGYNWIRHAELERHLEAALAGVEAEVVDAIELKAFDRLKDELARHAASAAQGATEGFRNYCRRLWDALDLEERGGNVADLVRRLLKTKDPHDQLKGTTELERLLPPLVGSLLEQQNAEHRQITLAMGRAGVTPRQLTVYETEARRLEDRLSELEQLRSPYHEQLEKAAEVYQDKLRRLEDMRRTMGSRDLLAKRAAVAGLFGRIIVGPATKGKPQSERKIKATFGTERQIDLATFKKIEARAEAAMQTEGATRQWQFVIGGGNACFYAAKEANDGGSTFRPTGRHVSESGATTKQAPNPFTVYWRQTLELLCRSPRPRSKVAVAAR